MLPFAISRVPRGGRAWLVAIVNVVVLLITIVLFSGCASAPPTPRVAAAPPVVAPSAARIAQPIADRAFVVVASFRRRLRADRADRRPRAGVVRDARAVPLPSRPDELRRGRPRRSVSRRKPRAGRARAAVHCRGRPHLDRARAVRLRPRRGRRFRPRAAGRAEPRVVARRDRQRAAGALAGSRAGPGRDLAEPLRPTRRRLSAVPGEPAAPRVSPPTAKSACGSS